MEGNKIIRSRWVQFASLLMLLPAMGCMGVPAQIMYIIKGHKIPASFNGLEGQRVAVVCVSDASSYGPNDLTYAIERAIGSRLALNVKDIELIHQAKVSDWKDNFGWDRIDYLEIGRGVDADMVLAIEISSYSVHDGSTLFKGRSNVSTTVFDMKKNGQVVFTMGPEDHSFPSQGRPAIQTSDRQFEAMYLAKLTTYLSQRFYPHEKLDGFADDATGIR